MQVMLSFVLQWGQFTVLVKVILLQIFNWAFVESPSTVILGNIFADILLLIIADYGTKTCAGYPGSINHIKTDAQVSISQSALIAHLQHSVSNYSQNFSQSSSSSSSSSSS